MSAAGTWTLALQTPIGDRKATVTFQLAGSTLSGRMTAEEGNATDIYEGHMGGKTASWKANIKNPMPLRPGVLRHRRGRQHDGHRQRGAGQLALQRQPERVGRRVDLGHGIRLCGAVATVLQAPVR